MSSPAPQIESRPATGSVPAEPSAAASGGGESASALPTPTVLFDVNVLVALSLPAHVHHRAAHRALADLRSWATTPLTEAALVRLLMQPQVAGVPLTGADALGILAGMRGDPRWRFIPDTSSLADPTIEPAVLMGHRQVTDLHLVNLAAASGCVLATFDAALAASLAPEDRRYVELLDSR